MADPTAIHARVRLGGGTAGWEAAFAPTAVARDGGVAGDGLNSAPSHEIAWEKRLRAAGDLANLTTHLHG
jgi:hypothetical protein